MAQVKVTITDDDGNLIGVHNYALDSELKTLSKMEAGIEELRPQILSDITHDLLTEEQKQFQKKPASSQEAVTR
jgi:hypothetical protein